MCERSEERQNEKERGNSESGEQRKEERENEKRYRKCKKGGRINKNRQ